MNKKSRKAKLKDRIVLLLGVHSGMLPVLEHELIAIILGVPVDAVNSAGAELELEGLVARDCTGPATDTEEKA